MEKKEQERTASEFSKEQQVKSDVDSKDDASNVISSISSLREEASQIDELAEFERNCSIEVVSEFKSMLEPLNSSFHIPPASLAKSDTSLTDIILTPQGSLCLVRNDSVTTKSLEVLKTETLLGVIREVAPQMHSLAVERRKRIAERVSILEKVTNEFRKINTPREVSKPQKVQQVTHNTRATDAMFKGSVAPSSEKEPIAEVVEPAIYSKRQDAPRRRAEVIQV